jgi:hypothetical protein
MTTTYSPAASAYVYNRRAHSLDCSCTLCVGERAAFDAGVASMAPAVALDPDADRVAAVIEWQNTFASGDAQADARVLLASLDALKAE